MDKLAEVSFHHFVTTLCSNMFIPRFMQHEALADSNCFYEINLLFFLPEEIPIKSLVPFGIQRGLQTRNGNKRPLVP